jgi:hypothetical protein
MGGDPTRVPARRAFVLGDVVDGFSLVRGTAVEQGTVSPSGSRGQVDQPAAPSIR